MVKSLTMATSKNIAKPTIIKAFATWCPHCNTMKPIFEALEKKHGNTVEFVEFDTDASPDLVAQFEVTSLPTFILIKNGKQVARIEGELPQEELESEIKKYLE